MKPKHNQLNPTNLRSKYYLELSSLLSNQIDPVLSGLSPKTSTKYQPVFDFFEANLQILKKNLLLFKSGFEENPVIQLKEVTSYDPDLLEDVHYHFDRMTQEFLDHDQRYFAKQAQEMKLGNSLCIDLFNLEMGVLYLQNLKKYVFEPLQKVQTLKKNSHKQARKILIIAKKLENFNRIVYRVHLSSFFSPVLNYTWPTSKALPQNTWEKQIVHVVRLKSK